MSTPELVERLIASLQQTAATTRELHDGMVAQRKCWVSARPDNLAGPLGGFEQLAAHLAELDKARQSLLEQLRAALPALKNGRIDAERIAPFVPQPLGRRLLQAAAEAGAAARALRVETQVGKRLLEFARNAHDSFVQQLAGQSSRSGITTGYSQSGRAIKGYLVQGANGAGSLVDGRF